MILAPSIASVVPIFNPAAIADLKTDPWYLYKQSQLDQAIDYPDPVPVLNIIQNGRQIPLLTRKSFSLWQGKAKSKKSTILAMAVAALIKEEPDSEDLRFEGACKGTVIYFDTEQGTSYAARSMKLTLAMAGLDSSDRLKYCDLRGFSPEERLTIIKAAIEGEPNVCLVVIDGVVDVVNDFMDNRESQIMISDLLALCSKYDIHVAGVLHQNKGDQNARGHTGTIAGQKCEIEISATVDSKDRSVSVIKCEKSRGMPFDEFGIWREKDKLPVMVCLEGSSAQSKQRKKKFLPPHEIPDDIHRQIIQKAFESNQSPKYNELLMLLKRQLDFYYGYTIGDTRVKTYISYYVDKGLLLAVGKTPHTTYKINQ